MTLLKSILKDLACCDEDEVCGTDGLITQNLIGCEDLPLDFRYEHTK